MPLRVWMSTACAAMLFVAPLSPHRRASAAPDYDLIITGARIIDRTGNPWFYGDVAVRMPAARPGSRF